MATRVRPGDAGARPRPERRARRRTGDAHRGRQGARSRVARGDAGHQHDRHRWFVHALVRWPEDRGDRAPCDGRSDRDSTRSAPEHRRGPRRRIGHRRRSVEGPTGPVALDARPLDHGRVHALRSDRGPEHDRRAFDHGRHAVDPDDRRRSPDHRGHGNRRRIRVDDHHDAGSPRRAGGTRSTTPPPSPRLPRPPLP